MKETLKTVAIAVLVTGIIAFIGGVKYEQSNSAQIQSAAKALVPQAQATSKN